eukprot:TRINITY_DN2721_c0_g1_i4.p1 TRINITY_DN2721_c0_g1~~TRINITY_DN2721_c0_g1_i4.p1  ORF type:complete len:137 (-),score=31.00 TRINITY_DN2721_c0_g1_i4:166-576(-)
MENTSFRTLEQRLLFNEHSDEIQFTNKAAEFYSIAKQTGNEDLLDGYVPYAGCIHRLFERAREANLKYPPFEDRSFQSLMDNYIKVIRDQPRELIEEIKQQAGIQRPFVATIEIDLPIGIITAYNQMSEEDPLVLP